MKLDKNAFEKMIHNVLSYDFDDTDGLHFRRFTKSQQAAYAAEAENCLMKTNASASATFDFITDSDYLALRFLLHPGSSQRWADFALYVDGIFYKHQYFDNLDASLIAFDLPDGEHRITLYFPWSAETVVKDAYLTDHASLKPVEKNAKVISFGDSITQGYLAKLASLSYVNQLAQALNLEIVNQGIGGYYFNEVTIDESIVNYKPDLITIAYGTNDYGRYESERDFSANISKYIEKLATLFPDTKMLAILPLYRNDNSIQVRQRYRDYTFENAREALLTIYRKYQNIEVLKETNMPRIPEAYAADYLHPNDLGFTFMAKAVEKQVKELLHL